MKKSQEEDEEKKPDAVVFKFKTPQKNSLANRRGERFSQMKDLVKGTLEFTPTTIPQVNSATGEASKQRI